VSVVGRRSAGFFLIQILRSWCSRYITVEDLKAERMNVGSLLLSQL